MRDAYRAELKRIESRIETDILKGRYNTKNDYSSKWVFFEPMSFIQHTMKKPNGSLESDNSNSNSNDNNNYDYYDNNDDMAYDSQFNSVCDIKMEPHHNMDEYDDSLDNNEEADNSLFTESKFYDTPPALSRKPDNMAMKQIPEYKVPEYKIPEYNPTQYNDTYYNAPQYSSIPQYVIQRPPKITIKKFKPNLQQQPLPSTHHNQPSTSKSHIYRKLPEPINDQMHFLENLEQEEQHLITSTHRDIKHSNNMDHIGDSDYNFLISFLPQMKKMTELQNLQFRAKMSEMVLKVLSPSNST